MSIVHLPPTQSPTRVCKSCLRSLPMERFRHIRPGSAYRIRTCMDCRVGKERERRRRHQERKETSGIRVFENELAECKEAAIESLVIAMLRLHGGPEGFAEKWFQAQEGATPNRRLRGLEGLMRLIQVAEKARMEAEEKISSMSPEELEKVTQREVEKLIKQNPQIAFEAARRLGWTIVPLIQQQH